MHTMYLVHQHKFTNKCTNLNYKLFISPELHDSLFVHASVAKRTCPTLANCHLVPWEISSIRNFSLTHQKFREILSFVLANYHSTTTNFNSTSKGTKNEICTFRLHYFCTILYANFIYFTTLYKVPSVSLGLFQSQSTALKINPFQKLKDDAKRTLRECCKGKHIFINYVNKAVGLAVPRLKLNFCHRTSGLMTSNKMVVLMSQRALSNSHKFFLLKQQQKHTISFTMNFYNGSFQPTLGKEPES